MSCGLGLLLTACDTSAPEKDTTGTDEKAPENMTFEERAHREYQAQLEIPVTEKYELRIYKAHLNADNAEDAVITINRLEFAIDKAAKTPNPSKHVEFGYMGNYNHVMFYDGQRDKFSSPTLIPSSAKKPLEVSFEHIQSDAFQTTVVEYGIRELKMKSYYFMYPTSVLLAFEWKVYDRVGTADYEANVIEPASEGEMSANKDIFIYKGKIKDYSTDIADMYTYTPAIEKTGMLLYRFFYDPRVGKYVTRKSEANGPLPKSNL